MTKSARRAFGGCGKFRRLLSPARRWPEPDLSPDENKLFEEFQRLQKKSGGDSRISKNFRCRQFSNSFPIWLLTILLLAAGAAAFVLPRFNVKVFPRRNRELPWARW